MHVLGAELGPVWRFYDRGAREIWGSGAVPHGITGNPRIASTYARIVQEFLRTVAAASGSTSADVPHIVEFGGGTGRFAYLFVRYVEGRSLAALQIAILLTLVEPESRCPGQARRRRSAACSRKSAAKSPP